jgi:hypothetical protein
LAVKVFDFPAPEPKAFNRKGRKEAPQGTLRKPQAKLEDKAILRADAAARGEEV